MPYQARRTEPFAIASLVCALAAVWFCFIGSILGIVFGHVARSRIKRTGDNGRGLALAGLIVGYVGLVLGVLGIAGLIVLVAAVSGGDATHEARRLGERIEAEARRRETTPRDALVIHRAVDWSTCGESGCAYVTVGTSGEPARSAYPEELAAAGWRLDVEDFDERACLTVPATVDERPVVTPGRC